MNENVKKHEISCSATVHVRSDDATNRNDGQSIYENIERSFDVDWNFIGHRIGAD